MSFFQDMLEEQIELWEPEEAEVVFTIDINQDTVERIVKMDVPYQPLKYFLYRYFLTSVSGMRTVVCSVDLNGVEADDVIQHLGQRVS